MNGKIQSWLKERGFGFIAPDDGGAEIFVHIKEIEDRQEPSAGDRVSFEAVPSDRRPGSLTAKGVRILTLKQG